MQKIIFSVLLSIFSSYSSALAMELGSSDRSDDLPKLHFLGSHPFPENNNDTDLSQQNLALSDHLESKGYYRKITAKINKLVSNIAEGIELADSLYLAFQGRLDDTRKVMEDKYIPLEKFYITALSDFNAKIYPPKLTSLFQELYVSYHYECLTAHFFNRSYMRMFMCSYYLGTSRSQEGIQALEKIIAHLENVRIDPNLLGQVAASEICSQKISPLTAISDRVTKMDEKQKRQFFGGMYQHLLSAYFHRSLSCNILEYANLRSSHKRETLQQVMKLAALSHVDLGDNPEYELDRIQKERFEANLIYIVTKCENAACWTLRQNADDTNIEVD